MNKQKIYKYKCDICKNTYDEKSTMAEIKITIFPLNAYQPRLKKYGKSISKINMCGYCKLEIENKIKELKEERE